MIIGPYAKNTCFYTEFDIFSSVISLSLSMCHMSEVVNWTELIDDNDDNATGSHLQL